MRRILLLPLVLLAALPLSAHPRWRGYECRPHRVWEERWCPPAPRCEEDAYYRPVHRERVYEEDCAPPIVYSDVIIRRPRPRIRIEFHLP
jgi:hypothetical protein